MPNPPTSVVPAGGRADHDPRVGGSLVGAHRAGRRDVLDPYSPLAAAAGAARCALLLGRILLRRTGGPTGPIALYDMSSRREIPLRGLRSSPRINTIKSNELTERGVKYVKVKRGAKDEDGRRTVIVSALGAEGDSYLDGDTLTDGVNEAFLPSAEIVYHSR